MWRARDGEDQKLEVFFLQQHRLGEAGQTDLIHSQCLAMPLAGRPFSPRCIGPFVLPTAQCTPDRRI
jgi:hypothetical protein